MNKRGGKRKGAGRKPEGKAAYTVTLTQEQLERYYTDLIELRANLSDRRFVDTCIHRMELILSEIQNRRIEARSDGQHQEAMKQGATTLGVSHATLSWTRVAAVAAIIGVIATVLFGILQIWLSNTDTSRVDQASPKSSPQTTTPMS